LDVNGLIYANKYTCGINVSTTHLSSGDYDTKMILLDDTVNSPEIVIGHSNLTNSAFQIGYRNSTTSSRNGNTSNILYFSPWGSPTVAVMQADGNVGIGTTVPQSRLHVFNGSATITNGNGAGQFTNNQIMFGCNVAGGYRHAIKSRHDASGTANNAIDFYVWRQGTDTAATIGTQHVMTMSQTGVGIGTTTTPVKLRLIGPDNTYTNGPHIEAFTTADNLALMQLLPYQHNNVNMSFDSYFNGTNWISSHASSYIVRKNNGYMQILGTSTTAGNIITWSDVNGISMNTNGNVGLGVTNAGFKLDISGAIRASSGLITNAAYFDSFQFGINSANNSLYFFSSNISSPTVGGFTFARQDGTSTYMRITGEGNVGVGTVTPLYRLDVNGSTQLRNDLIIPANNGAWNNTAGKGLYIRYSTESTQDSAYIQSISRSSSTLSPLRLQGSIIHLGGLDTSERLTVDNNSGNVGVGTVTPLHKLDVNGNVNASSLSVGNVGVAVNNGDAVAKISVLDNVPNNPLIAIGHSNINNASFWIGYNCGTYTARFPSLSNFLYIAPVGSGPALTIKTNGNVGVGTTSTPCLLSVGPSGQGPVVSLNARSDTSTSIHGFGLGSAQLQFMVPSTTHTFGFGHYNGSFNQTATITGAGVITKTSGTFDIQHPIKEGHRLVHSFIEGPRCDLIYRGAAQLTNGTVTIDIDQQCVHNPECGMTPGTFKALCTNPMCYLQNTTSFARVIGTVSDNSLTITCEDQNSSDVINWMVVAERKDSDVRVWDRTNDDGYLITEYVRVTNL
jgi:hypothetical protein